jgi:hypothetical protein
MSKTSNKQRYIQIMEWLGTLNQKSNSKKQTKFSKAKHYKSKGVR